MGGPPMNSAAHHQPKIPTSQGPYPGRPSQELQLPETRGLLRKPMTNKT